MNGMTTVVWNRENKNIEEFVRNNAKDFPNGLVLAVNAGDSETMSAYWKDDAQREETANAFVRHALLNQFEKEYGTPEEIRAERLQTVSDAAFQLAQPNAPMNGVFWDGFLEGLKYGTRKIDDESDVIKKLHALDAERRTGKIRKER